MEQLKLNEKHTWSPFGLGTWKLGGRPPSLAPAPYKEFAAIADRALETGMNWFDTAGVYGLGAIELNMRRWLQGLSPERRPLVVAKCGVTWSTTTEGVSTAHDLRPTTIERQCQESIERLGVDALDVLLLHWPDSAGVPIEDSWQRLSALRDQGAVATIGVSNFPQDLIDRCHRVSPVEVHQFKMSPMQVRSGEAEAAWCLEQACQPLAYEILGSGEFLRQLASASLSPFSETIQSVAASLEASSAAVLARWSLHRMSERGSAVLGVSTSHQLDAGVEARQLDITPELLGTIDKAAKLEHPAE